ncbi:MAG: HD domain-containing protein [Candidatus Hodarchaeota archaeon]
MSAELERALEEIVRETTETASRNEWLKIQEKTKSALYNYRYDHVKQVVAISKRMAEELNANMEVVTLAAWLHDAAKPGMGGVQKHGKASARTARKELLSRGINEETVEQVCDTIEKHIGLTLEKSVQPLEAKILWDADKIAKLGMIGLLHFLVNGIKMRPGVYLEEVAESLSEFLPLAEEIVKSMNTDLGRKLATRRLETLRLASTVLDAELELQDFEP